MSLEFRKNFDSCQESLRIPWNGQCPSVLIIEIYLKRQKPVCFPFKGIVITFSHLNNATEVFHFETNLGLNGNSVLDSR